MRLCARMVKEGEFERLTICCSLRLYRKRRIKNENKNSNRFLRFVGIIEQSNLVCKCTGNPECIRTRTH